METVIVRDAKYNKYDNTYFKWKYNDHIPYTESSQELKFISHLKTVAVDNKINVCYAIEGLIFIIDHLIPLFHVLPGPLVCSDVKSNEVAKYLIKKLGFPKSLFVNTTANELNNYMEVSKNNIVVSCSGRSFHDIKRLQNYIIVTHGVDEDHIYENNILLNPEKSPTDSISLVFSKFSKKVIHTNPFTSANAVSSASSSGHASNNNNSLIKLDPKKKTIMFSGTVGPWDFFNLKSTPKHIWKKFWQDLVLCTRKYNVIVRPHPHLCKESMKILEQSNAIILTKPLDYPFYLPFVEKVDVIMGPPTGIICASTYYPKKPLVVLRPHKTWDDKINFTEIAKANNDLMLGDKTATIVTEKLFMESSLKDIIKQALANANGNNAAADRVSSRKQYFKYWFGQIDGYEEYRVWTNIFRDYFKANTTDLDLLYSQFP